MLMLQRAIHVCHDLTSKRENRTSKSRAGTYTVHLSALLLLHRTTQCLLILEDTRHICTEKSVFSHLPE